MRIYELKDKKGRMFAFEVENAFLGRAGVCKVVQAIPNIQIIRKSKMLSYFREESFCEFIIDGKRFEAFEPFGDNSRYWIGPKPPKWCKQVSEVSKAFTKFGRFRALWPF
jgi:hypothetical protein